MRFCLGLLGLVVLASCSASPSGALPDAVVGTWEMRQIYGYPLPFTMTGTSGGDRSELAAGTLTFARGRWTQVNRRDSIAGGQVVSRKEYTVSGTYTMGASHQVVLRSGDRERGGTMIGDTLRLGFYFGGDRELFVRKP